jgi:hypothetical protein
VRQRHGDTARPARVNCLAGALEWEDRMAKQTFDPRNTLERLEEEHRTLKRQVAHLDRRAFLTPAEQREATDLKKKKLATKDAITALRARMN